MAVLEVDRLTQDHHGIVAAAGREQFRRARLGVPARRPRKLVQRDPHGVDQQAADTQNPFRGRPLQQQHFARLPIVGVQQAGKFVRELARGRAGSAGLAHPQAGTDVDDGHAPAARHART